MRTCSATINTIDGAFDSSLSKAIVGMQQSLVLWRTNDPWNIFISIVGTPATFQSCIPTMASKKKLIDIRLPKLKPNRITKS
jgi:hypothetical protein